MWWNSTSSVTAARNASSPALRRAAAGAGTARAGADDPAPAIASPRPASTVALIVEGPFRSGFSVSAGRPGRADLAVGLLEKSRPVAAGREMAIGRAGLFRIGRGSADPIRVARFDGNGRGFRVDNPATLTASWIPGAFPRRLKKPSISTTPVRLKTYESDNRGRANSLLAWHSGAREEFEVKDGPAGRRRRRRHRASRDARRKRRALASLSSNASRA